MDLFSELVSKYKIAKGDVNVEREYKTIFSAVLARNLIQKGFIVKDIKPNVQDKKRTVFIFENTRELSAAISDYIKK